jgi:alkanesulfonate monooxygenase SsuD/methylene tetrahydromethanopterin reductase-like flavin-dependent oxidoreductase (luciferase family)
LARKAEALGYATFIMADHYLNPFAPVPGLLAAARPQLSKWNPEVYYALAGSPSDASRLRGLPAVRRGHGRRTV